MRAVVVEEYGGPEVLRVREVPEPRPGSGEVVVAVVVAPIDFVQTQLRRGVTPGPPLPAVPYTPGSGVAGRVLAVGEGVSADLVGTRVLGRTPGVGGANAERAVAAAASLIPIPDGVSFADAAALQSDGSTAIGLVEGAGVRPGEYVLVEAAAGGLGSLLVQLSRAAGARVVGAARGEAKLAAVRKLGAEAVVDYSLPGWTEEARAATGGAGFDLVFDGVGGEIGRAALGLVARGGRLSVHGASSGAATEVAPEEAAERGVTVLPLSQLFGFGAGAHEWTRRALEEAAAGRLTPLIGATLPLEQAAEAHAAMEARAVVGKTLLIVDEAAAPA
ncbi:zinc-binding dehydrogenase [Streptomonospora nanhaiensis]|uniref:NADPH2:quinone reductase n=1 Tax=Streptomonospora nanhaiensis TaxID=1323731 RepID=A0A853BMM8_9ACTN|nr:zinc-binding dehydrogenase [Streptomonospora nanhaiensis]MBV2366692.1 zinc-binding dehydrogenase [Streptomonospora nanhaiensis]MBX9389637.1 zinc-binding dehydrogenase [Streptomonospora nanhaiensis]NYI95965.1 NADPH2:quinone reductase [Streptomonospora nanhaiensis]